MHLFIKGFVLLCITSIFAVIGCSSNTEPSPPGGWVDEQGNPVPDSFIDHNTFMAGATLGEISCTCTTPAKGCSCLPAGGLGGAGCRFGPGCTECKAVAKKVVTSLTPSVSCSEESRIVRTPRFERDLAALTERVGEAPPMNPSGQLPPGYVFQITDLGGGQYAVPVREDLVEGRYIKVSPSCTCTQGACSINSQYVPFKGTIYWCDGKCTGTCTMHGIPIDTAPASTATF